MAKVWTLDLSRERKLVLLALADHADDDGYCFPSAAYVGWKTEYSERQIQRILDQLEKDKLVKVAREHSPTTPRVYQLTLGNAKPKVAYRRKPTGRGDIFAARGDILEPRGDISPSRGDIAVSPEPPLEPSSKPSIEPLAKKEEIEKLFDEMPSASALPDKKNLHGEMVIALTTVCDVDPGVGCEKYVRLASRLLKAGYSPGLIRDKYGVNSEWYRHDWRGQKGQPPDPRAIADTVKRAADGSWATKPNGHDAYAPEGIPRVSEMRREDFTDWQWARMSPENQANVLANEAR